jgi:serine palmitoyltransferase
MDSSPAEPPRPPLLHYAQLLTRYVDASASAFQRLPGSAMFLRYIKSSYQNDPVRSVIEAGLVVFLLVYIARSRFSTERSRVVLSEEVSCDTLRRGDDWADDFGDLGN